MSTSQQGQQPMYTIEQIELIRRLRNSGLTKEQVVKAFDAFERVDAELGNIYTIPVSLNQQRYFLASLAQAQQARHGNPSPQPTNYHQTSSQPASNGTSLHHASSHTLTNGHSHSSHTFSAGSPAVSSSQGGIKGRNSGPKRQRSEEDKKSGGASEVISVSMQDVLPETRRVELFPCQGSAEVNEFIKKSPDEMYSEIQQFLSTKTAGVVHSDIATSAGVGLSCVRKFLDGNFSALEDVALRQLSQWFLTIRGQEKDEAKISLSQTSHSSQDRIQLTTSFFSTFPGQPKTLISQMKERTILPKPTTPNLQYDTQTSQSLRSIIEERLNNGMSPASSPALNSKIDQNCLVQNSTKTEPKTETKPFEGFPGVSTSSLSTESDGLVVNFTPRRERFKFIDVHREILEREFQTNQYPAYDLRTEIAVRCNNLTQAVSGRELAEKEKMNHQNVAYWFSNRRKDIKRMAKEGGIETAEVILPSKVSKTSTYSTPDTEKTSSYWDASTAEQSHLPSVGPVAFPFMVQRSNVESVSNSPDPQSRLTAFPSTVQRSRVNSSSDTPSGSTLPTMVQMSNAEQVSVSPDTLNSSVCVKSEVCYSPVDLPSLGPVAFPTMVHRSTLESSAKVETLSVSNSSAKTETAGGSSNSQSDTVSVKQERVDS